jgi:phage tail sheath protein FI
MPHYRSPGVYIDELNTFPTSVAQVETAIPAFVGYTEKAHVDHIDISNRPYLIQTYAEFEQVFGTYHIEQFDWSNATHHNAAKVAIDSRIYYLSQSQPVYLLYKSIKLYFQNGGKRCYVVSAGNYQRPINKEDLITGINSLLKEPEPSLLVVPDAVSLANSQCAEVQNAMIEHCAKHTQKRVAILDVQEAETLSLSVQQFSNNVTNHTSNDYAAAYYPWLITRTLPSSVIGLGNFSSKSRKLLANLLRPKANLKLLEAITAFESPKQSTLTDVKIDKVLRANCKVYLQILAALATTTNTMPPSAAVAGAIVNNDLTRGVWKAPANIALINVTSVTTAISDQQQNELSGHPTGPSINAIRDFAGRGILLWGARTLDRGNAEYQYLNVRRTSIMIEQSVQNLLKSYVFEPNDANTWSTILGVTNHFLDTLYRSGAFAGTKSEEAFAVRIGLRETMTEQDIAKGILRISVAFAMLRPAEFILLNLEQVMQKS